MSTQSVLENLEHLAIWINTIVLGEAAFFVGVSVGLAKSVWSQVKGLYMLPRTFLLAAQYEISEEARRRHFPAWAVRGAIDGIEAGMGLAYLTIDATPTEEKQADETVRAIIHEVKTLMDSGPSGAWAQLKTFGGNKWAAAQADWDLFNSLSSSGDPAKLYDAGVLYGQFLGELITTILLIISVAGIAVRVAKLAASGAVMLADLAGLMTAAEGTELGTAAKTLAEANAELQAARAANNTQRIAQAEKASAEAARNLQQKAEAAQKLIADNAPNLAKQTQALEKAKTAQGAADSARGSAAEEPAPRPSRTQPKPEKSATEPAEEKQPSAKEKRELQKAAMRERARQTALDKAIAKADQPGGSLDDIKNPEDRAWLESDPRNKELAIDPDGNGGYKVSEAKAALQAEQDGSLPEPVRRATSAADPAEAGADIIDGNNQLWDVKNARLGASGIARTANGGENVLVDCAGKTAAEQQELQSAVQSQLSTGAGQVKYVNPPQ